MPSGPVTICGRVVSANNTPAKATDPPRAVTSNTTAKAIPPAEASGAVEATGAAGVATKSPAMITATSPSTTWR